MKLFYLVDKNKPHFTSDGEISLHKDIEVLAMNNGIELPSKREAKKCGYNSREDYVLDECFWEDDMSIRIKKVTIKL